jgi:uncharacterized protein (DUF1800 family)
MASSPSPLRLLPKLQPDPSPASPILPFPRKRRSGAPPTQSERNVDLLSRATNGVTLSELDRLNQIGRQAWLREQLAPTAQDNLVLQRTLAELRSLRLSISDVYAQYGPDPSEAVRDIKQAAIVRAVHSDWQLRERMVDFWHDHFSVAIQTSGRTRLGHHAYDREVIRANVFGSFETMLQASAKSVSMLEYLNGRENVSGSPNENYAREVMELHTLGVDGPYTEEDIAELARCLTGWSFYPLDDASQAGDFWFRDNRHDDGPKTLLGLQIPAGGGQSDGETVLSFLAQHPQTVDFVSRKLVHRFVSETAPESAVDLVKGAWIRGGGDLRIVTAVLFSDEVANAASPWDHRKVKRPFQFAAGLLRALDLRTDNGYKTVMFRLTGMGQDLFAWPAPNGYPDSSAAWSGDLYGRWEFAAGVARGNVAGIVFPDSQLVEIGGGVPTTALAERLSQVLTAGRAEQADVASLQAWIDGQSNFDARDFRDAITVMASSPDFFNA